MASNLKEDLERMQRHIRSLNMNGLKGRVLKIKAEKKSTNRDILMVYGHHASLERMFGVAEAYSEYGTVTMPDLPGFGGMDSFYSLGMKPTIDNYADYLATFVKLRYRSKKVTLAGVSLGFVIITRMLQRYPDLVDNVDVVISVVGFAHKNDFAFSPARTTLYKSLSYILSKRISAWLFYHTCLHPTVIRTLYSRTPNAKSKFVSLDREDKRRMLDFEVILWRINDVRTHAYTNYHMFLLDNCIEQVALPVHHVAVDKDQYFNKAVVEQHFRIIYTDYVEYEVIADAHAPSIIANKNEAKNFIPDTLRAQLGSKLSKPSGSKKKST